MRQSDLIFPPGEFLAEEIAARGWSRDDVMERSGLPREDVHGVLDAICRIDERIAAGLSRALGTSAELWLGLEQQYSGAVRWRATGTEGE